MKRTITVLLLVCLTLCANLFAKEVIESKPWEAEINATRSNNSNSASMELPATFRTRSLVYAKANAYEDGFFVSFDTDTPGEMNEILAPPAWTGYAGDFAQMDDTTIYVQDSDTFELLSINVADGVSTVVGSTGLSESLTDMAMNKTTGVMYAIDATNLYTVDVTTGTATLVGSLGNNDGTMISLACDGATLWGIDMATDDFWSIDATTGAATMIGAVGFDLSYAQSMAWDPATGSVFWASYGGGLDGKLRTIDTATGAATVVADFEGGREVTVLAFPGGGADPLAPNAPTAFTVTPDAAGAFSVEIAWTNPALNVDEETLAELTAIKVYKNDVEIHSIDNPTIGGTETYTDAAVTENGLYAYSVMGINTNGDGIAISETVFVGNDVPAAVTELALTVESTWSAVLNWTNPTTGLNGGYFDGTITGFTIVRSDDVTFDVTGDVATYTDASITDASGYYSYSVTPINATGNGASDVSNTEWVGDTFSGILVIDVATDNNTGAALQTQISAIYDGTVAVATAIDEYPIAADIEAIFISAGWYSNGGVKINDEQAIPIVDYIAAGGNVYIEGGDTFGWDPDYGGYNFNPLFGIESATDGSSDLTNITGEGFISGTNAVYSGVNNFIDRLVPTADAEAIFSNQDIDPAYYCGVALDNGTSKTIAVSFQLSETDNSAALMNAVLTYFGLGAPTGSLTGIVTNGADDAVIEGAIVTIGTQTRTTNAAGEYTFSMLLEGDVVASCEMAWFETVTATFAIVADTDNTHDFALVALPAGSISGTVTDLADDAAIEGATITVGELTVQTDVNGDYTITPLTPADYAVSCTKSGYDVIADLTVTVTDGAVADADFALTLSPDPILPVGNLTADEALGSISWTAPGAGSSDSFSDDFESYNDFVLDFAPWALVDVDLSATYGFNGTTFDNAYAPMAYIIFNPSQTVPAIEDLVPHSGDKVAACFASTTPGNNDWMITPQIAITTGAELSFWAKSFTDEYGLERFNVGVSTTGANPDDFTIISSTPYEEAPAADWGEFTYDLSSYNGQQVYVGIQCVSNDAFVFLVDDVTVGTSRANFAVNTNTAVIGSSQKTIGTPVVKIAKTLRNNTRTLTGYEVILDGTSVATDVTELTYTFANLVVGATYTAGVKAIYDNGDAEVVEVTFTYDPDNGGNEGIIAVTALGMNYPNPFNPTTNISFSLKEAGNVTLEVYNAKGQKIKTLVNGEMTADNHVVTWNGDDNNGNAVSSGIYFYKMNTANHTEAKKMLMMK